MYSIVVLTGMFVIGVHELWCGIKLTIELHLDWVWLWNEYDDEVNLMIFNAVCLSCAPFMLIWSPRKMQDIHRKIESYVGILGEDGFSIWAPCAFWIDIFAFSSGALTHLAIMVDKWKNHREGQLPPDEFVYHCYRYLAYVFIHFVKNMYLAQLTTLLEIVMCQFEKLNALTHVLDLEICTDIHADLCSVVRQLAWIYGVNVCVAVYFNIANILLDMNRIHFFLTVDHPSSSK